MSKFKIGDRVRLRQRTPSDPIPLPDGWIPSLCTGVVTRINWNGGFSVLFNHPPVVSENERIINVWDLESAPTGLDVMLEIAFGD